MKIIFLCENCNHTYVIDSKDHIEKPLDTNMRFMFVPEYCKDSEENIHQLLYECRFCENVTKIAIGTD